MKKDDIVSIARKRMSAAVDFDRENREHALEDLQAVAGENIWPEEVRQQREAEGRPTPSINRLPRFVRQVTGDIRNLNPAIKVIAGDEAASPEVAEVYSGLVRQIQASCDASSVFEGAAENAAQCGIGNFRILTDYEDSETFNQIIRLEPIPNPLAVYWDPAARKSTRADAGYCFVTDQMPREEFEAAYPDATPVDAEHDGTTDGLQHWHESGNVVIAEYFWKERTEKRLALLPDGSTTYDPPAPVMVVQERKVETVKVMWAKVSGNDVLEGPQEVPSKHIPIISVTGEELYIGDRINRTSVIRFAREPAQIYNYYAAADIETRALQPKAPYLVTAKHVKGLERFWNEANDANRPYLPYTPDEKAPPPQRITPPLASSGMIEGMQRAEEDMKATTGIFDAAMGARSNEQSGVAIRQRQLESDISTSIYTDNLKKAIEQAGNVIVDMIPQVYDTQRMLQILGEDGTEKMVPVNAREINPMTGDAVTINDLTAGKYSVRVTVGPNYTTRRQETAESMMQFVTAFPAAGQVAGDLIAEAMDWPKSDELADRLKKLLPPGMIAPEDMDPEQQAQMAQQMQAQAAQSQMEQAGQQIELRKAEAEVTEAEADAQKAQFEVMEQQLQVAAQNGELQAMIAEAVQQQVAATLMAMQQGYPPQI